MDKSIAINQGLSIIGDERALAINSLGPSSFVAVSSAPQCRFWVRRGLLHGPSAALTRLLLFLLVVLLTGCASQIPDPARQTYWDIQRATKKFEQDRLLAIYGGAFTRGFMDAWEGTNHSPGDRLGISDNSDADSYNAMGYYEGHRAGMRARKEHEKKQAESGH
jgi:hypothetical protein